MSLSPEQLAKLRERYGEGAGDDLYDPKCRRVADMIFESAGRRTAPYVGLPSLLDAPIRQLTDNTSDLGELDVALFGVPLDLGVTNRSGARFGPRALRSIERVGPYNEALDCAPVHELRVADIGDVPFRTRYDLSQSHEDIRLFSKRVVQAGALPLAVGGDHSISHPLLSAVALREPVGMIHIDAHCDTGGVFEGERFHHGGPFRNAVLEGFLDPHRTIQIGIRGAAAYLWEFSEASGMTVVSAPELERRGVEDVLSQARGIVGDGPVYISFDIDSLDPAFAPGTGTPEVGGLTTREALALVRGMRGLSVIGGDVVEVAPQYDSGTNTAQAAAQILFEILSVMQFSPMLAKVPGN